MPYIPGAVVHGVRHIADVYHSENVFANFVNIALWNDPQGPEATVLNLISAPTFTAESITISATEGESEDEASVAKAQQGLVASGVVTQEEIDAGKKAGSTPLASSNANGTANTGTTSTSVSIATSVDETILCTGPFTGKVYKVKDVTKQPGVVFPHDVATVAPQNGTTVQAVCENLSLLILNCYDKIKSQYPDAYMTNSFRKAGVGSPTSQHPRGQACDIQFSKHSKAEYYNIAVWIRDSSGIAFDQLLLEYKTTGTKMPWIHISFNKAGNRGQVMTFMNDKNAKGPGVIGLYDLSNT
jgi:hypothetical protein